MSIDLLLALMAYAFVTSITPGPNNTMLLASGANFGLRRTTPHILGVNLGFAFMVLAVGLGVGGILVAFPLFYVALRYGGAAYLLYLAWKIARSSTETDRLISTKPMTFVHAAAFQWVNPKTWIMAIGAVATYTPHNGFFLNILIVSAIFALINGPCIMAWAGFGVVLRKFLVKTAYLKAFNITMAMLLVLSLYPLLKASMK